MATTITANVLPANVTIENISNRAKVVQLYGRNMRAKLESGDKLILRITTSEQSVYYQSIANAELSVTVAAVA